jgi:SAM-dependent methyltransferase
MLTVRYELMGIAAGDLLLDLGAGFGRHAYEAARKGARVVALDYAQDELVQVRNTFGAMFEAGELPENALAGTVRGDATKLPFADGMFKQIMVTVPTWYPEKINWMLSDEYHAPKSVGGHVRIYTATELKAKLRSAGMTVKGQHHAHALHSPYWWLKCAVGPSNNDHPMVTKFRKLLEKDIIEAPRSTRLAEKVLSPVMGKSYVVYSRKQA